MTYLHVFFFNDTATTEIYTLSLHDALPIYTDSSSCTSGRSSKIHKIGSRIPEQYECRVGILVAGRFFDDNAFPLRRDRKSTRLNSSHGYISYAVFCLKKKKATPR